MKSLALGDGLIFFLASGAPAAASLESAFAAKLVRARREADVRTLRATFDRAKVARASCALQIRRDLAPLDCYEVLALERAWNVTSPARHRAKLGSLDAGCTRAALRLAVSEAPDPPRFVSSVCRARVREARETRRYRAADPGWSED